MVPAPLHKRLVSTLAGRQGRSLLWAACTLTCLLLAAYPAKAFTPDQVDRGRESPGLHGRKSKRGRAKMADGAAHAALFRSPQ